MPFLEDLKLRSTIMANTALKMTVLALIGLGIGVADVHADKAQLEERLRQDLAITLEDVTIAQALEQIGQKAGVTISLSPEAIWKLPEGEQTRLSVTLEGRLAESLEKMLNSFFMRYAVGNESLTIYPRPELKHIIGRPTADELKLLRNIYGNPMWASTGAEEIPDEFVQKALNGLAKEPVDIMPPDEIRAIGAIMYKMMTKSTSSAGSPHDPNAPKGTPLTMASLLDGIERFYAPPKTWCIEGPAFPRQVSEIRIVGREEFWRAHLDQVVDVSFRGETGASVLRTLAAWGDLTVHIPQGPALESLAQTMTLEVQNVKLADVIERAFGVLGIGWTLNLGEEAVIEFRPPFPTKPVKEASQSGEGYIGKISIPMDGGRYFIEFMLRESDLPEELRTLRRQAMNEVIAELSREGKIKEVLKQLSSQPAEK
jgi:hypothetical protein